MSGLKIFTDEWIGRVDSKLQERMQGFDWGESIPKSRLLITYKITLPDGGEFTYHISCGADESRVFAGDAGDSKIPAVVFNQSSQTALGIMDGTLNTHIEFLMGNIHVAGDVLALESYSQALEQIQACFAEVTREAKI